MTENEVPFNIIPFTTFALLGDSGKRLRKADTSFGGKPKTAQSVANGDAFTPT